MAFEVFDKKAVPNSAEAWVTLQKRGNFSFNRKVMEVFESPKAVELLYDKENKLIGFRPTSLGAPRAYPVRQSGNTGTYLVAGMAFSQYYGIPTDEARRYSPKLQDGMLVIDLKGDYEVATGPRLKEG